MLSNAWQRVSVVCKGFEWFVAVSAFCLDPNSVKKNVVLTIWSRFVSSLILPFSGFVSIPLLRPLSLSASGAEMDSRIFVSSSSSCCLISSLADAFKSFSIICKKIAKLDHRCKIANARHSQPALETNLLCFGYFSKVVKRTWNTKEQRGFNGHEAVSCLNKFLHFEFVMGFLLNVRNCCEFFFY